MRNFTNNTGIKLDDIHNVLSTNKLSLKEKGLYVYLLSKGDAWIFSAERIAVENQDGMASVKNCIRALEVHKLLKRTQLKNERGMFSGMHYEVFYRKSI